MPWAKQTFLVVLMNVIAAQATYTTATAQPPVTIERHTRAMAGAAGKEAYLDWVLPPLDTFHSVESVSIQNRIILQTGKS